MTPKNLPFKIFLTFCNMRRTINFNDELQFSANKIYDIITNNKLPVKLIRLMLFGFKNITP